MSKLLAAACLLVLGGLAGGAAADGEVATPREYLQTVGLDDAGWESFVDDQPLSAAEREHSLRILFRLRQAPNSDLCAWAKSPAPPAAVAERPAEHRGRMLALSGVVQRVHREPLAAADLERLDLPGLYRCEFKSDDGNRVAILTGAVPKAWPLDRPCDERAVVHGVFLKRVPLGGAQPAGAAPLVVAPRVAWYPATPLGRLGFDVGLLDDVHDRRALAEEEHEAFYQTLAAAGRADAATLLEQAEQDLAKLAADLPRRESAAPPAEQTRLRHTRLLAERGRCDVEPLFNRPQEQRGRLVVLEGVAVRAIEIRVDSPDVRRRLGVARYFEMELVTDDSQNNPLAVCLRELPPGLPTGAELNERVRVAAFYFKQWRYPTRSTARKSPDARQYQLTPLLVGRTAVWYPAAEAERQMPYTAWAVGIPLALLAACFAWKYFIGGRGGRASRREQLPERISLEGLSGDAPRIDTHDRM